MSKISLALKEARGLNTKQLTDKIDKAHQELIQLRQNARLGRLKNYRQIVDLKRRIARLKTVVDEKVSGEIANV